MNVIENQYVNPFGLNVNKDILVSISLPYNFANEALNQEQKGKSLAEGLSENVGLNSNAKFQKAVTKK